MPGSGAQRPGRGDPAETEPCLARFRQGEGHRVRQRRPDVEADAPGEAEEHHVPVGRGDRVRPHSQRDQDQEEGGDHRLGEAGDEDEDAQGGNPAAFPDGLQQAGLEAADTDLTDEEIAVEADLERQGHPDERRGDSDEEESALAIPLGNASGRGKECGNGHPSAGEP